MAESRTSSAPAALPLEGALLPVEGALLPAILLLMRSFRFAPGGDRANKKPASTPSGDASRHA